jgi:hypothetical protein
MSSAVLNQSMIENPSINIAQTVGNEPIDSENGENVPSKETRLECQDFGAITCDEGSFDEIFRSSGSGGPEETICLSSEPVVPANVSMNTDPSTTNTIHPYNVRVLRAQTQ